MSLKDLFAPAWMTDNRKNEDKAVRSVEKTDDQAVLRDIVLRAPLQKVKLAAAERLTDPELLKEIARAGIGPAVSQAAVGRISDRQTLFELARSGPWAGAEAAMKKLDTEQKKELIATAADPDRAYRVLLSGLEDDEFLRGTVVAGARELPCLKEALSRRSNADITAVSKMIKAALSQIRDQAFLYDVVMGNIDGPFTDSVYNSDKMESGVHRGWDAELKAAAAGAMDDQSRLFQIVTQGPPQAAVWKAAISRMHSRELLSTIVETYGKKLPDGTYYTEYNSREWAAKEKLKNRNLIL